MLWQQNYNFSWYFFDTLPLIKLWVELNWKNCETPLTFDLVYDEWYKLIEKTDKKYLSKIIREIKLAEFANLTDTQYSEPHFRNELFITPPPTCEIEISFDPHKLKLITSWHLLKIYKLNTKTNERTLLENLKDL